MSAKRILLLLVAIIAGGIAAFLAVNGQKAPPTTQLAVQVEAPEAFVLISNRKIGLGQRITPADLAWQEWPEAALRSEYITKERFPDALSELAGVVVRFEIFAGEPVREEKIVRSDQGYLSAVIGKGMRAVSIRISPESGAGGFIVPNDRVDVILTSLTNLGKQTTTILENVRVLAIGLRLGETAPSKGEEGEQGQETQTFQNKTTATVELRPEQAEDIINAERLGTLSLALRSVADFAEFAKTVQARDKNNGGQMKLIRYGRQENLNLTGVSVQQDSASDDNVPSVQDANYGVGQALPDVTSQIAPPIAPTSPGAPPPSRANSAANPPPASMLR